MQNVYQKGLYGYSFRTFYNFIWFKFNTTIVLHNLVLVNMDIFKSICIGINIQHIIKYLNK